LTGGLPLAGHSFNHMVHQKFRHFKAGFIAVVVCLCFCSVHITQAQQWVEVNSMDSGEFPGVTHNGELQISCFASIGTHLFAGCVLDGTSGYYGWDSLGGGVYLSTDSGVTWTNTNLPSKYSVDALLANGPNLFAGTFAGGVWRSTDSGGSWAKGAGIPADDGYGIYKMPLVVTSITAIGPNLFAAAADAEIINGVKPLTSGVYLSIDNGFTWARASVNNGLPDRQIYTLGVMGTILFAGYWPGEVSLSTNNGTSWSPGSRVVLFPDGPITAFATLGRNLYAAVGYDGLPGGSNSGVFRSTDSGQSWNVENNGLTAYGSPSIDVTSLAVSCSDIYAGTYNDVFRSTDSGASWTVIDSGFPFLNFYGSYLLLYVDDNYLYATPYGGDAAGVWRMPLLPINLSVSLQPGQLSSKSQELDTIPIYASSTQFVTGGSVTFRINMRTDLLTPASVTSPVGATAAPLQIDSGGAWITLTLPPNFTISSDTLIANVICRAYVTDTNETAISLASTAISNSSPNCLSISGSGEMTFTLIPDCVSPILTQFLSTGTIGTITNIVPNPATGSIKVVGSSGPFTIFDPLGRIYRVPSAANTLDISSLPSGGYFVSDGLSRAKFVKE
jgi:hypothetical protein